MKLFLSLLLSSLTLCATAQGKPEGLFLNAKAPEFKAKDANGNEVALRDLRKKGPVVVLFYRGHWCPYCNRQLKAYQDSLQMFTDQGASLVAITPEGADGLAKTREKTGATFPVLSDGDMKISNLYGVKYEVDEKSKNRYKNFDIDLNAVNGQRDRVYLPVPAVYIIDKEGTVVYRYFNEDYKKRPSVRELLAQLR